MAKTVSSENKVLTFIKSKKIKFVDLKFMDFPGQWQHFTVPASQERNDIQESVAFFPHEISKIYSVWKNP